LKGLRAKGQKLRPITISLIQFLVLSITVAAMGSIQQTLLTAYTL